MKNHFFATERKVGLNFGDKTTPVGRLAIRDQSIYFEYHALFIDQGIEPSPLRLPLQSGVTRFDNTLFEGLAGVFNDSLPDGWGRLLLDRFARSQGIMPNTMTPLDRLAHVGQHCMGALVYEPDYSAEASSNIIHLDTLSEQMQAVLYGSVDDVLQELLALNGSSAGARPKALIGLDKQRQKILHGTHPLSS